jgi:30S ribosomal protein S31
MGKGDKKSKKGKVAMGSYGNSRLRIAKKKAKTVAVEKPAKPTKTTKTK